MYDGLVARWNGADMIIQPFPGFFHLYSTISCYLQVYPLSLLSPAVLQLSLSRPLQAILSPALWRFLQLFSTVATIISYQVNCFNMQKSSLVLRARSDCTNFCWPLTLFTAQKL